MDGARSVAAYAWVKHEAGVTFFSNCGYLRRALMVRMPPAQDYGDGADPLADEQLRARFPCLAAGRDA